MLPGKVTVRVQVRQDVVGHHSGQIIPLQTLQNKDLQCMVYRTAQRLSINAKKLGLITIKFQYNKTI